MTTPNLFQADTEPTISTAELVERLTDPELDDRRRAPDGGLQRMAIPR